MITITREIKIAFGLFAILIGLVGCGGGTQGRESGSIDESESATKQAAEMRNKKLAESLGDEGLPFGVSTSMQAADYGVPAGAEEIQAAAKKLSSYFGKPSQKKLTETQRVAMQKALRDTPSVVYRFFNTRTGVHFYTISAAEKTFVEANLPAFNYEGEAFAAVKLGEMSLNPVYRFYNIVTGTHFYTISESEKQDVQTKFSNIFQFEGVAWYGSTTSGAGWIPIHRFFNKSTGTHFYTASDSERNQVQTTLPQMVYEGIGYYVRQGATFSGKFVDAPVQGLKYKTATREGFTDVGGGFVYDVPDEPVEFFVGALSLGVAKANNVVDVFALKGSTQDPYTDRGARVAQFLQSVDSNAGDKSTIQIDFQGVFNKINDPDLLDFNAQQIKFDAQLATIAASLGKPVVSGAAARVNAAAYLSTLGAECPLPEPLRPNGVGGSSYITCLDRARINYYQKVAKAGLNNTRDEATAQLALVEATFNEDAVQAVVDRFPLVSAMNVLDSAMDAADASDSGSVMLKFGESTKVLTQSVQTGLNTFVLFSGGSGSADSAKQAGLYIELSNAVIDTISNGVGCYDFFAKRPRSSKAVSDCSRAVKSALDATQRSLDPYRSVFSVNDQSPATFDAALNILGHAMDAADAISSNLPKSSSPDALRRAVFTVSKSGLMISKEAVQLHYINNPASQAQWKDMMISSVGAAADIGLSFAEKCYAKGRMNNTDRLKCYTEVGRQLSTQIVRLTNASLGSFYALKNASTQNEAIVASAVLDELLWAGVDGIKPVYARYQTPYSDETPYAARESMLQLIRAIALKQYDINAYLDFNQRITSMGSAFISGQQRVDVESVHSLVMFYLTLINQNVHLDYALPSIQLAATHLGGGKVNVAVTVNPAVSGFVRGELVCQGTSSTSHSIASPWTVSVNASTSNSVVMSFATGGSKPISCALYSAQGLFVGSNAVSVNVNFPATVTDFSPTTAELDQPKTFTVTGTNLPLTAVFAIADAECQAPVNHTATGFQQTCTPRGTTGSKAVTIKTNAGVNGGVVIDSSKSVLVSTTAGLLSKLPHSGITSNQCYTAGSNNLVACSSTGAIGLNSQQDGNRSGINTMSYQAIGSFPITSCVRDMVTGLVWEGKESSGQRLGGNTFTNYHVDFGASQSQMDAASNAQGYVNLVNGMALCGYTDWRLPSVLELISIVDYGSSNSLASGWFPNSSLSNYWTSSRRSENPSSAWMVSFSTSSRSTNEFTSASKLNVRLVRGGASALRSACEIDPGRITDVGSGMLDNRTKLIWNYCPISQNLEVNDCNSSGAAVSLNHENALKVANYHFSSGWRLPSVKELSTAYRWECSSSGLGGSTWTSTPNVSGGRSYTVGGSGVGTLSRGFSAAVILVKDAP